MTTYLILFIFGACAAAYQEAVRWWRISAKPPKFRRRYYRPVLYLLSGTLVVLSGVLAVAAGSLCLFLAGYKHLAWLCAAFTGFAPQSAIRALAGTNLPLGTDPETIAPASLTEFFRQ